MTSESEVHMSLQDSLEEAREDPCSCNLIGQGKTMRQGSRDRQKFYDRVICTKIVILLQRLWETPG